MKVKQHEEFVRPYDGDKSEGRKSEAGRKREGEKMRCID